MASPMLGMAIINAIVFGVQGNLMKTREDTILNQSFTGSVAGICQSFICSPMELIKLRMQLQTDRTEIFKRSFSVKVGRWVYHNPWDAVSKIVQRDGVRGLYKGLELTLTREVMNFSVFFGTYEYICTSVMAKGDVIVVGVVVVLQMIVSLHSSSALQEGQLGLCPGA